MGIPDRKVVYIPENGEITEWPTYGMTALRLMTIYPDPKTGEDVYPTEYELALAKALLTGDWSTLRQFDELSTEEEIGAFKETIQWYDINAPEYTKKIENIISVDQAKAFINLIQIGGVILDAGCGGGRDSAYFKSMGYRPIGIDLSEGMIDSARKAYPDHKFVQASFLNIPFPGDSFDGIWTHASIHHLGTIKDVQQSLHEFNRVLKINGVIHLATQAKTGTKDTAIVGDTLSGHNRFYRFFTISEIRSLLEAADFRILSINQHKETDDEVNTGRKNVEWIVALAIKD